MFLVTLLLASAVLTSCASKNVSESADGKKAEIFYQHGTQKLVDKDYTNALDLLIKAAALNPNDTKIENNLGMAYFFKKQTQKAKEHLSKSIKLDPKNSDARNNIASVYLETGEYDLAEKEYKKITEDLIYTSQYTTYYNLALVYLKKNQKNLAVESLKKSIKENEDYCPAYYLLGGIFKAQYQYKDALDMFRRGSKGSCYDNPAPHYEQAMIHIEMNDFARAKEKLKEIIERFPNTNYGTMASERLKAIKDKTDSREYKVMTEDNNYVTPAF